MERAAIFGGSFNPPHLGHLAVAQAAIAAEQFDRLFWVPTHRPPHKRAADLAPMAQRAYMLRLALADLAVCRVVCEPTAHSGYAIETFAYLSRHYPAREWSWLLGLDAFARLPYWYQRQELVPAVTWLVAPRAIAAPETSEGPADVGVPTCRPDFERAIAQLHGQGISVRARLLSIPELQIAATALRDRYATGKSCRHLVPAAVDRYIRQVGLYREMPFPPGIGNGRGHELL